MINAIAPEIMDKLREVQQASSVAPVPPEVEQILNQAAGVPAPAPEQTQQPETQQQ